MKNWYVKSQVFKKDYDLFEEYGTPEDKELAKARQWHEKKNSPEPRKAPRKPRGYDDIKFDRRKIDAFINAVASPSFRFSVDYIYNDTNLTYRFKDEEYEKLCRGYLQVFKQRGKDAARSMVISNVKKLILKGMNL